MFTGVALMESPLQGRTRTRVSTSSSTIIRTSETESNLDYFQAIHSVHVHGYEDASAMVGTNHELLKSPSASETQTTTTTASTRKQKYRVLGTLSLIGITYMGTAGGPVGSELLITAGGPLLGLVGIALYILLCQIPISLMVTELCCAFPENGGFAVWAMAAFNPFWGFQAGYWAWIVSVVNNAIFPGMIYQSVTQALGVEATSGFTAYMIMVAIAGLLALPSYFGTRFIGVSSLIMLALVFGTTAIFTVWGSAAGDGALFRLKETRTLDGSSTDGDNVDWLLLIRWQFGMFDRVHWISMIGGEVRNPAHTFPRVIFFTVLLAVTLYVAPFITAVIGDKTPWREVADVSYTGIANALGGPALENLVVFSSIVSGIGLFMNSTFLQTFLIQGMAQSQLLPGIFRKRRTRFKSPKYALLVSLATTMVVLGIEFDTMIGMSNTFSCANQVVIVLSMLQLRRVYPNLHRPMRVPGNLVTLTLMLLPALCLFLFVIGIVMAEGKNALLVVAFAVPGFIFPIVRKWLAGRRLCA